MLKTTNAITMYDLDDCLLYLKQKLLLLDKRTADLTKIFTLSELQKEKNIIRSTIDILAALKQLREMSGGEEKEAALDMLLNSEAV